MTRPDDSLLTVSQLATIRRHADKLLKDASALNRFPTPIDDLMEAAKLIIVADETLSESFIEQLMIKAKAGVATIKSALSKVLGLFEANDRLVLIDPGTPKPKVPFVKLHEAGHGTLPHQSKIYKLVHDCAETLNADITDLFEREANVFASEVLFQGDVFSTISRDHDFSIKVPMDLAKKFGASNYATFRRYVTTNHKACCVVVLEPSEYDNYGQIRVDVRRVVSSTSFELIYDSTTLCRTVNSSHPIASAVPGKGRRMISPHEIILVDRNGDKRVCMAEAFNFTHQTLVLLRDIGRQSSKSILVPKCGF